MVQFRPTEYGITTKERESIEKKIKLLSEITIENNATPNEEAVAKQKIAELKAKLPPDDYSGKVSKKLSPEQLEERRKQNEAGLAAFGNFLNKEYQDYNMKQHHVVIGDLSDSANFSPIPIRKRG